MKRFLSLCLLLLASFGCSHSIKCIKTQDVESCARVLFIGNSYTSLNDLPAMFAELAYAGGHGSKPA